MTHSSSQPKSVFKIWTPDSQASFNDVVEVLKLQDIEVGQWSILDSSPKAMGRRFIVVAGKTLAERVGNDVIRVQYSIYKVKATIGLVGRYVEEGNTQ